MKLPLLLLAIAAAGLAGCRPPAQAQTAASWPAVLTLRGDTVTLAPKTDAKIVYAILYNEYSCKDCFPMLATALRTHDSSAGRQSSIVAVSRAQSGSGAYARRLAMNTIKNLVPGVESVYFDLLDSSQDDPWPPEHLKGGIFGACGVTKTPSLLVLDGRSGVTLQCLPYDELFSDTETDEPRDAQLRKLAATLATRLNK